MGRIKANENVRCELTEKQLARLYDARYNDGIQFVELEERFGYNAYTLYRAAKRYATRHNLPTPTHLDSDF